MVSHEFGSNDGQGRVVAGHITADTVQEVCKARDGSVRCMTRQQAGSGRKSSNDTQASSAEAASQTPLPKEIN